LPEGRHPHNRKTRSADVCEKTPQILSAVFKMYRRGQRPEPSVFIAASGTASPQCVARHDFVPPIDRVIAEPNG
jgi:hypothetical protein